jgi:WS/DGAT/MGAT family acyltransferase
VRLHGVAAGEAELEIAVSALHAQPLDRTRPLWECHVFDGLPERQFALYVKVHHALLDGVGGLRLMQKLRAAISHADQLVTPYRAPASPFNRRITANRAFSMECCELARIKRLAHLGEASSNDVVLAVCAGALQRLLADQDVERVPLTAAVPVSTRPRHDGGTGTALSFCLANLATDIRDPRTRLRAIRASTRRAKEHLGRLPRAALTPYTATLMLPFLVEQLSRVGGRLRPMFNVVISNVPGPKAPLYLEGARLETATPLSVLFHGQALNITCIRYTDRFSFGFTGCPDVLPGFEHLAGYARESLEELEAEFSFPRRLGMEGRRHERMRTLAPAVISAQN